jgi:hypothetical protein
MSQRLSYSVVSGHGTILLTWPEPVRFVKMPWAMAYRFATEIKDAGLRAETEAGLTIARGEPEMTTATIRPEGGAVKVDWGLWGTTFIWQPGEAFAIANALVIAGELAQRWGTQGPSMTPKEVDKVEETILGNPTLTISVAGKMAQPVFFPEVGQTYYYRPADANARVLALSPNEQRANVLLMTGQILEGIVWADLLIQKPVAMHSSAIPSDEVVGQPRLS